MSFYISKISDDELYHHGIKGQRWGVRRYQNEDGSLTSAGKKRYGDDSNPINYRSTGIKSALARRSNEKVDKSFKKWKENSDKRDNAIDLGKKANAAKLAYENNKGDKSLRSEYKKANSEYKKALHENTTYRKGVVKQEVGRDAARHYLSEAKKIKKQLEKDPSNKELQKKYNQLMSKHDTERASARRAVEVASNRSKALANLKRRQTMLIKSAVGTAAVTAGAFAVNKYLNSHDVRLNGKRVNFGAQNISDVIDKAKNIAKFF